MTEVVTRKQAKALGLKTYFTGKPCINGHVDERYTLSGSCLTCRKEIDKAAWADPEKKAKKLEALSRVSRETLLACAKRLRDKPENKEKRKEYNKKYHEGRSADPAFRAKKVKNAKEWANKNKEKSNLNKSVRRNRKRAAGYVSAGTVIKLLELQKYRCAEPSCKKKIKIGEKNAFHLDHIMPISKGGDNSFGNLQCLCPSCNQRKSAKLPEEWAKENGRLI